MRIMVTNGGPHPADRWATVTAEAICNLIQVDPNSESEEAKAARRALPRLQIDLADALEPLHLDVQTKERGAINTNGCKRLGHRIDVAAHMAAAVDAVLEQTDKTVFAAHFRTDVVKSVLRNIVGQHFTDVVHVERSWLADQNPSDRNAKEFRKRFQGGVKQ